MVQYKQPKLIGLDKLDYFPVIQSLNRLGNDYINQDPEGKDSLILHGRYLTEETGTKRDPRKLSRESMVAYRWGIKSGSPRLREALRNVDQNNLAISNGRINEKKLKFLLTSKAKSSILFV